MVYIRPAKHGATISLARRLADQHEVKVVVRKPFIKRAVEEKAPELSEDLMLHSEFEEELPSDAVIPTAKEKEEEYDETFTMILSTGRHYGRGYHLNMPGYQDAVQGWEPHREKMRAELQRFCAFERMIDATEPDFIVSEGPYKPLAVIARARGIPLMGLDKVRWGDLIFWTTNEYGGSREFDRAVQQHLKELEQEPDGRRFPEDEWPVTVDDLADPAPTYPEILQELLSESVYRTKKYLYRKWKGRRPSQSVKFMDWARTILRHPSNYHYLCEHGYRPEDLDNYRLVYFPLHVEPEASLSMFSPELNNSREVAIWISKSLPADALIVVKENPAKRGMRHRTTDYYDTLRRIGNVVLAHPDVHSWDWIESSRIVATFTGTAGFEAVHFRKPVLSFGRHQAINYLPTVRYADSFMKTRRAVEDLLALDDRNLFERSREALYRAQMEVSFDGSEIRGKFDDGALTPDLAERALDNLVTLYGEELGLEQPEDNRSGEATQMLEEQPGDP